MCAHAVLMLEWMWNNWVAMGVLCRCCNHADATDVCVLNTADVLLAVVFTLLCTMWLCCVSFCLSVCLLSLPEPFGIVFDILLIAHGSFCYLLVSFLHLLLLVHHGTPPAAVHTLACVHVHCLEVLVKRAQALLQVMGFSENCLVPTPKGLVMKLVIGWPASA